MKARSVALARSIGGCSGPARADPGRASHGRAGRTRRMRLLAPMRPDNVRVRDRTRGQGPCRAHRLAAGWNRRPPGCAAGLRRRVAPPGCAAGLRRRVAPPGCAAGMRRRGAAAGCAAGLRRRAGLSPVSGRTI
jgi:hypothetical protein